MVSVVIPNYNGIKYLRQCLKSLYGQIKDINAQVEVIIVDNASTDDDYKWIKLEYPSVIWKQLNQNYGFSRAVNEGIYLAKEDYILLLNNDTEVLPGFVEEIVNLMQRDERIFAVSSQMIQYHKPHLIDDAGDEYTLLGWTRKNGDGELIAYYNEPKEVFSACAGAALYRKSVFDEIGYFDEHFFAYMEDVDLAYRARIHGYKNMYCPDAKVLHIGSATSGSKYNDFKVRLAATNNVYVPYKNMPLLQLLINLPFLILGCMIKYLFFIKKGYGKTYREGVTEGLKTLHKIEKVPFKCSHIGNYIKIEWLLIKNTWNYFIDILHRR